MGKKIAVFTGAGVSAESGISTFRDVDGLWYNYNVDEVATLQGFKNNPTKVMEFHNMLRAKLKDVEPNEAHKALVKLEDNFDVTIVTQNVDNLHERAGSTNILHLHGELYKSRPINKPDVLYDCFGDLNLGDKDEEGNELRPHTVLFEEYPYNIQEAYEAITNCDYLLIIGTSLQIGYTLSLLKDVQEKAKVFYIDPTPARYLDSYGIPVTYIPMSACEGVPFVTNKILNREV